MLESLVVPNRPRPFRKEECWCFLTLPFSLRVSHNKTGCSQFKNFILLNCWKFWKNFQKRKISLRQNFFFFHAVQFVFSINVVLQYYLQNSSLRVASKIWVGIDVQLCEFHWTVSINNGGKKNLNISKSDLSHIIFERSLSENLRKG